MQLNALLTSIAKHPIAQAAAIKIASEVAEHGIGQMIDQALDRIAYSIAKQIVKEKKK